MKFKKGLTEKNVVLKCGADMMLPFAIVFGIYIILFGTVSPGGGFQGGVMVAAAAVLLYLGYGYSTVKGAINTEVLRVGEACGAVLYVILGFCGLFVGALFCRNIFFDNGAIGDLISAGTITFMGFSVGFKVLTGVGFLLLIMMSLLAPGSDDEEEE
ncbi:MAG: MnhB domain-containing protein, partial [Oscillospiraceae bacterium]|nr:MnhB domain-containing protein [Oscillospiraceae bacterium]